MSEAELLRCRHEMSLLEWPRDVDGRRTDNILPFVYMYYTYDAAAHDRLTRFQHNTKIEPDKTMHHGGVSKY